MDDSDTIIKIIANRFATIYGAPASGGPCACMGVSCGNLACTIWWRFVLEDEEIKARAVDIYTRHKEEIENGIGTLLKKRFLI